MARAPQPAPSSMFQGPASPAHVTRLAPSMAGAAFRPFAPVPDQFRPIPMGRPPPPSLPPRPRPTLETRHLPEPRVISTSRPRPAQPGNRSCTFTFTLELQASKSPYILFLKVG